MNLETQIRRLEQQLDAFETLHREELKKFEEKLATYSRLQADEVKFLREELAALKQELADREVSEHSPAIPVHQQNQSKLNSTVNSTSHLSRRQFLSGNGKPNQS